MKLVEGGKEKWVDADIDKIPMFIKEGAIIPKYPCTAICREN